MSPLSSSPLLLYFPFFINFLRSYWFSIFIHSFCCLSFYLYFFFTIYLLQSGALFFHFDISGTESLHFQTSTLLYTSKPCCDDSRFHHLYLSGCWCLFFSPELKDLLHQLLEARHAHTYLCIYVQTYWSGNLSLYLFSLPLSACLSITSLYTCWSLLWSMLLAGPGFSKIPLTNVFQLELDVHICIRLQFTYTVQSMLSRQWMEGRRNSERWLLHRVIIICNFCLVAS